MVATEHTDRLQARVGRVSKQTRRASMGEGASKKQNHFDGDKSVATATNSTSELDRNQHVERLIAELERRSAELEEANRKLRRVSHYRWLFLARMSHELRTPLTSILGFSEILLEQEQLTEAQHRFC